MLKKIGLLYHPMNKSAGKLAKELEKSLTKKGFSIWLCSSWDGESARSKTDGTELILSIGGDGTSRDRLQHRQAREVIRAFIDAQGDLDARAVELARAVGG